MDSIQAIDLWFYIQCSKGDKHSLGYFRNFVILFIYFVCSFNYVLYFLLIIFSSLVFIFPLDVPFTLIDVQHIELPLCMKWAT